MRKLIDAEELKNEVRKDFIIDIIDEATMNEIIGLIDNSPREPHFVPVNVALPEEGNYLVTVENDQGKRSIKTSTFFYTENMTGVWGIETSPIWTVLAWMSLPEIWEG